VLKLSFHVKDDRKLAKYNVFNLNNFVLHGLEKSPDKLAQFIENTIVKYETNYPKEE